MKLVVAGAGGLLGRHLSARLSEGGHEVVGLVRSVRDVPGARVIRWSPDTGIPPDAAAGATAIVNLAGESIGTHRWTESRQASLLESRIATTRACVEALADGGPSVLVNASAIGFYGATTEVVDERAPAGADFLASLCQAWEKEARRGEGHGRRVAIARFGVVLARDGGALPKMASLARFGVNGPLGGGRQWISWVHVDDAVAAIELLVTATLSGPFNVVAPSAVRQRDLARELGRVLHRPSFLPAPRFGVTAALGSGPASLVLEGQAVAPTALTAVGFHHRFPELGNALRDLLG